MDHLDKQSAYTVNKDAFGNVKVWRYSLASGFGDLLIDKPNLITTQGADIAARALSGNPNTFISHMYVGYNTDGSVPTPSVLDTVTSFTTKLRKKLAFSPSFSNEPTYSSNLVYFTTFITGTDIPDTNQITSLGLICATDPNSDAGDLLFSKIAFSPIIYSSTYGLAVSWGITFRSQ